MISLPAPSALNCNWTWLPWTDHGALPQRAERFSESKHGLAAFFGVHECAVLGGARGQQPLIAVLVLAAQLIAHQPVFALGHIYRRSRLIHHHAVFIVLTADGQTLRFRGKLQRNERLLRLGQSDVFRGHVDGDFVQLPLEQQEVAVFPSVTVIGPAFGREVELISGIISGLGLQLRTVLFLEMGLSSKRPFPFESPKAIE